MNTHFSCFFVAMGMLLSSPNVPAAANVTQTSELVAVLRSDSSLSQKAQACQRLGEFGSEDAVPALAALLNHKVLGTYARAGLERIPHPSATEALRTALGTTEGNQLIGVINSLGALRDPKSVGLLSRLTTGSEPGVIKAALLALGRISDDQAIQILREALGSETNAFRATAAAACLIAAEQQLDRGASRLAASLYDAVRQADVPAPYRVGATHGAIVARQPDHVPLLVKQLRSEDQTLRDMALLTIREIPSDAIAEALNREVTGAGTDLQALLITAMLDCHDAGSISVIRSKVQSTQPKVRLAAITVLSKIGGPDEAPILLHVLTDPRDPQEVAVVMARLAEMPGAGVDELILQAVPTVSVVGPRVNLIRLLERRRVTAALDELLKQTKDPEPEVSIAAFRALRPMVGVEHVARLLDLTRTLQDDPTRTAAEQALVAACAQTVDPGPGADLILGELEHATDPSTKMSCVRVLTSLGYGKALPTVAAGLRDDNRDVVSTTITQLGKWPDPAPVDILFGVLEGSPNRADRKRALTSVLQLTTSAAEEKQRADEVLVAWFERANQAVESVQEKRLLVSGLGRVPHVQSIQLLDRYLDDPEVQAEAVVAWVGVAEPLAKGEDYAVVQSALEKVPDPDDAGLRQRIANVRRELQASEARYSKP